MFWFADLSEDQFHTVLIYEIIKGKVDKFEILLKTYEKDVLQIVGKRVPSSRVAEFVHEAFVRAFFSLKTFKGIQPFRNWLSRIAIRTCYDFWRDEYKKKETPVSALSENGRGWLESISVDDSDEDFLAKSTREEAVEVLSWVMEQLSPDDRAVISLHYFEGKGISEIAEIMEWTESNVKIHAHRARKKMRVMLAGVLFNE